MKSAFPINLRFFLRINMEIEDDLYMLLVFVMYFAAFNSLQIKITKNLITNRLGRQSSNILHFSTEDCKATIILQPSTLNQLGLD